jgi:transposase-like protein
MRYSAKFKARMVRRMTGTSALSATALAAETGVSQASLSRWLNEAGTVKSVAGEKTKNAGELEQSERPRRPEDWTPEEKLGAIIEASSLSEEELGRFLRSHGLHTSHLAEWRAQAAAGFEKQGPKAKRAPADKRRIKELEKQLRRKEKALAEAAALLVLQKKARAIWGDEDDSTDPTNDD